MNIIKTIKFKNVPYAISTSKQITTKPTRVDNLVLYRKKEDNTIVCLEDKCPHRGARLSQGSINKDDEIICPYHGWQFNEKGLLTVMPSHKSSSPSCIVPHYNITEDGGYVWINYQNNLIDKQCPEMNDKNWGKVQGSQVVQGNWFDWVSNSWDVSHINYVHDFGDEANGIVYDLKTWNDNIFDNVINATCKVNSKPINWTTNHMQTKKTSIHFKSILPNTTRIDVQMKKPYKFITFTSVMPITINESLLTWSFLWNFGGNFWEKSTIIKNAFKKEMAKTISEDENLIKNIDDDIPYISVPADGIQLKCTNHLEKLMYKYDFEYLS